MWMLMLYDIQNDGSNLVWCVSCVGLYVDILAILPCHLHPSLSADKQSLMPKQAAWFLVLASLLPSGWACSDWASHGLKICSASGLGVHGRRSVRMDRPSTVWRKCENLVHAKHMCTKYADVWPHELMCILHHMRHFWRQIHRFEKDAH